MDTLSVADVLALDDNALLRPYQVAQLFGVDPKTVRYWCVTGRLVSIRTPGGHRRIYAESIKRLLSPPV